MGKRSALEQLRRNVYAVIEGGRRGYLPGRVFSIVLMATIIVNVATVVLGTLPDLPPWVHASFDRIELFSVGLFTLEYAARLWVAVEDPHRQYRHPLLGRLRFAITPMAIIDLLAIAPFFLGQLAAIEPEFALLLRVLRLAKMIHFTGAFEMIGAVLVRERRSLLACAGVVTTLLVLVSTMAYLAERTAQPEKFGSIPTAMYWGLVTLSTVGYGDLAPVTPLGRIIGGIAVVLGVMCFAMPAGILASGFIEEVRRRDFIVTWQLVAKVPLFARLSAARIASIAGLLRPERVESGEVIVYKGDAADRMYFVLTGEIEVAAASGPLVMGVGDYFGEMGLIERTTRSATVTARTACTLLTLMDRDFWALIETQPELEAQVRANIERRRATAASPRAPAS
ncbi:MAG: ion transporter [Alphaproteobacteria bacterium]|nr:ion transporter [Alphaproteobacteria bacterium]